MADLITEILKKHKLGWLTEAVIANELHLGVLRTQKQKRPTLWASSRSIVSIHISEQLAHCRDLAFLS